MCIYLPIKIFGKGYYDKCKVFCLFVVVVAVLLFCFVCLFATANKSIEIFCNLKKMYKYTGEITLERSTQSRLTLDSLCLGFQRSLTAPLLDRTYITSQTALLLRAEVCLDTVHS